jgi:hypothetical protein
MTALTRRGVKQRVEETALTGRLALHGAAMMAQEGVHERKRNPGDRAEATNRTACWGGSEWWLYRKGMKKEGGGGRKEKQSWWLVDVERFLVRSVGGFSLRSKSYRTRQSS